MSLPVRFFNTHLFLLTILSSVMSNIALIMQSKASFVTDVNVTLMHVPDHSPHTQIMYACSHDDGTWCVLFLRRVDRAYADQFISSSCISLAFFTDFVCKFVRKALN